MEFFIDIPHCLGEGKSKKDAKLACSQSALLTLFGQTIKPEGNISLSTEGEYFSYGSRLVSLYFIVRNVAKISKNL